MKSVFELLDNLFSFNINFDQLFLNVAKRSGHEMSSGKLQEQAS